MERLLWIDMEMTGLDVDKERIIEVAAIITDRDLNPIESFESVVFQDQSFLDNMDKWNSKQHRESGLIKKIPTAPKQEEVEKSLCSLVNKHFGKEKAILCGNSINQDRKFIEAYMPSLTKLLHYRILDVTAWKLIMNSKFSVEYKKKQSHRALDDIKESITELKTFIDFVENKRRQ